MLIGFKLVYPCVSGLLSSLAFNIRVVLWSLGWICSSGFFFFTVLACITGFVVVLGLCLIYWFIVCSTMVIFPLKILLWVDGPTFIIPSYRAIVMFICNLGPDLPNLFTLCNPCPSCKLEFSLKIYSISLAYHIISH